MDLGHIFHGECIRSWFTSCSDRGGALSCPQCKTGVPNKADAFRLYPSEPYDLDSHLQRHAAFAAAAELAVSAAAAREAKHKPADRARRSERKEESISILSSSDEEDEEHGRRAASRRNEEEAERAPTSSQLGIPGGTQNPWAGLDTLQGIVPGLVHHGAAVQRIKSRSAPSRALLRADDAHAGRTSSRSASPAPASALKPLDSFSALDRTRLEEGEMPLSNDAALLGSLLDFTRALQAYVIAVHGLRLQTARKAGKRIWTFVESHIGEEEQRQEMRVSRTAACSRLDATPSGLVPRADSHSRVQTMFESLETISEQFRTTQEHLHQCGLLRDEERRTCKRQSEEYERRAKEFDTASAKQDVVRAALKSQERDLRRFERKLDERMKRLDQRETEVAKIEEQARADVRNTRLQANRDVQDANRKVAEMRAKTDAELAEMSERVQEAERLMAEADEDREAAMKKSNDLAASMTLNGKKMARVLTREATLRTKVEEQEQEIDRLRLMVASAPPPAEGPSGRAGSSSSNIAADFFERRRPRTSAKATDDNVGDVTTDLDLSSDYRKSHLASSLFDRSGSSSSSSPATTLFQESRRGRPSDSFDESLQILRPDYDAEMRSSQFPMPGGLQLERRIEQAASAASLRPPPAAQPQAGTEPKTKGKLKAATKPAAAGATAKAKQPMLQRALPFARTVTPQNIDVDELLKGASSSSTKNRMRTPSPEHHQRKRRLYDRGTGASGFERNLSRGSTTSNTGAGSSYNSGPTKEYDPLAGLDLGHGMTLKLGSDAEEDYAPRSPVRSPSPTKPWSSPYAALSENGRSPRRRNGKAAMDEDRVAQLMMSPSKGKSAGKAAARDDPAGIRVKPRQPTIMDMLGNAEGGAGAGPMLEAGPSKSARTLAPGAGRKMAADSEAEKNRLIKSALSGLTVTGPKRR